MQRVLVVGAGPTGLLLAGDLAEAGVPCTLLEQRGEESNLTRAFAVHARTLEQLDARGVADELLATGIPLSQLRLLGNARLDLSDLPTRFPFVLSTPQYHTERVLEQRAVRAGAELVRRAEVVAVRPGADGVEVEDRRGRTWRGAYLVGTDGVRSRVRRALGLAFPGRAVLRSVMLADVRLRRDPPDVLAVGASGDAFGLVVPFGDGWFRAIGWNRRNQLSDDAPVDLGELSDVLREALGVDLGPHDARWTSRFHSDERQVSTYRVGRVFLAGDAAHVHSPAGGQGMNTGLQDAANLGWKLAAAVQGRGSEELLDSYHAERHPVGRMVLRLSGTALRAALVHPRPARLARDLLARNVLRVPPLRHRAGGLLSGIGIAYPRPPGAHELVGRRAPDVALDGGSRLYEALRGGRFVLVDGQPSVLVRPDGYVGWAGDPAYASERTRSSSPAMVSASDSAWPGRTM
jgi:2-polyprenyl-6-methoxyphenol hydroxylase-like FAD-dependent oxidoreductase